MTPVTDVGEATSTTQQLHTCANSSVTGNGPTIVRISTQYLLMKLMAWEIQIYARKYLIKMVWRFHMGKLQVPEEIKAQIVDAGFTQKGNWFLREESSIVQCIVLERPARIIYPTYCVIPLYMPCDMRYYTYGRRMDEITNYISTTRIDTYSLISALNETVFPFFKSIRTPSLLLQYLLSVPTQSKFFFCPPVRLAILKAYTALFLFERKLFIDTADEVLRLLNETECFTDTIKNQIFIQLEVLRKKANENDDDLCSFFNEIIKSSRIVVTHGKA